MRRTQSSLISYLLCQEENQGLPQLPYPSNAWLFRTNVWCHRVEQEPQEQRGPFKLTTVHEKAVCLLFLAVSASTQLGANANNARKCEHVACSLGDRSYPKLHLSCQHCVINQEGNSGLFWEVSEPRNSEALGTWGPPLQGSRGLKSEKNKHGVHTLCLGHSRRSINAGGMNK